MRNEPFLRKSKEILL